MSDFRALWLSAPSSVISGSLLPRDTVGKRTMPLQTSPVEYLDLGVPYRRQFERIPGPWHLPNHWTVTAKSASARVCQAHNAVK